MTELALLPGIPSERRPPRLGYALTIPAATLFALNGAVSKLALDGSGIGTLRWTELRATGSFLGIAVGLVGVIRVLPAFVAAPAAPTARGLR
mgnify:CR=1 FL=1